MYEYLPGFEFDVELRYWVFHREFLTEKLIAATEPIINWWQIDCHQLMIGWIPITITGEMRVCNKISYTTAWLSSRASDVILPLSSGAMLYSYNYVIMKPIGKHRCTHFAYLYRTVTVTQSILKIFKDLLLSSVFVYYWKNLYTSIKTVLSLPSRVKKLFYVNANIVPCCLRHRRGIGSAGTNPLAIPMDLVIRRTT